MIEDILEARCKFCSKVVKARPAQYMLPHAETCIEFLKRVPEGVTSVVKATADTRERFLIKMWLPQIIAEFIVGAGVPFSVLDHPAFEAISHFRMDGAA